MITYRATLKSRKQIMAEIPREQQGWWADVAGGQTLILRDAYEGDLARCFINEGQPRNPDDYLCETFKGGCLVKRIAIAKLEVVKNCHSCEHLEWITGDSDGRYGDDSSGYTCNKRPEAVAGGVDERRFLARLDDAAYRNRYKRCYERAAHQPKEGISRERP